MTADPHFNVMRLSDSEYISNMTRDRHSYNGILLRTSDIPYFMGVISNDLE